MYQPVLAGACVGLVGLAGALVVVRAFVKSLNIRLFVRLAPAKPRPELAPFREHAASSCALLY